MKHYAAEVMGTFALVFAGTGAIVINQVSGGAITHPLFLRGNSDSDKQNNASAK